MGNVKEKTSSNWIWVRGWQPEHKETPALVLFRKVFDIQTEPAKVRIQISADSRYKLYVNGIFVEAGPSKGDRQVWFYDTVDLSPYLKCGENVLAAEVLRYPTEHSKGNHGIFRTEYPGLYVREVPEPEGQASTPRNGSLDADGSWKARIHTGFRIKSESDIFAPLQIYEERQGMACLNGWKESGYDDSDWQAAWEYPSMNQAVSPGNLLPRTIPYLYRKRRSFREVVVLRQSEKNSRQDWEALLRDEQALTIPAGAVEEVEIGAGEEMTGFLRLSVHRGKGAKVTILQSESYVQPGRTAGGLSLKKDRTDWEHGHLEGFVDTYQVCGYGTEQQEECYEPFWFRTFRFIRLEIAAEDEPVTVTGFDYTETGYPLEVKTEVRASDERMEPIWEISERTLRRCMHETYEDCPFYEQLQYAMDARSQILYTYATAADDRLARKCMDDFRRSQRYDGLLNCSYPCYGPNVIPGFSIYYILMLHDHMMYFDDLDLLEEHLPVAEGILHYFHRNREAQGYVKKIGGLNGKARYWSFIDWAPEWDETTGAPTAVQEGAITMESLLYIMGLQHMAEIEEHLGRAEVAARYRQRAAGVQEAVRRYCTGKNGMLTDGPGVEAYSQHVQVFAILTDTLEKEQAVRNLTETVIHKEQYAQCSVAMAFYLFRALQKTGLYAQTKEYWNIWQRMLDKHATTCVEDEIGERSDCHAWGSLILYELPAVILGVRPASPGYEAVTISPEPGYLDWAKGSVITPKGVVKVKWIRREHLQLEYALPDGMRLKTLDKQEENGLGN